MARTRKSRENGSSKFKLRSNRDGNTTFKMMGSRAAFPKSDTALVKGIDAEAYKSPYKKTTPYKDEDDNSSERPTETNNVKNTSNVDSQSSTENMSFDVPKKGENLKGSGFEYDAKGNIVSSADDDEGPKTKVNVTDQFGKDTDAAMEGSDDIVDSQTIGNQELKRRDTYVTDTGEEKVVEYDTRGDREMRGKQEMDPSYRTSGDVADADAFSQQPVSGVRDDGTLEYGVDEDVIGDDYYVPTGITSGETNMIGARSQKGMRDPNAIYDAPGLSAGISEGIGAISGRNVYEGEIKYGDDAGKKMKLVGGRGPDGNLVKKKGLKDGPLGLDRTKEVTKRNKQGLKRNRETGELEFTDQAKRTVVSKGPLGLGGRDVYVEGRKLDKEYKQEIKQAKKDQKQQEKQKEKAVKQEKKRIHNKTKHVYKGMNAGEAERLKGQHEKAARESGMSYEAYMEKNFEPPPKQDNLVARIKDRDRFKEEREQRRAQRSTYDDDDYYASNERY